MSKIAIKGATTGTGVFTLESPATNTDRTLILPDEAGTVLTSGTPTLLPKGVPVVRATLSATQTITGGVWTKVQFNNKTFDTNNFFDITTNYRFQPTIAGYYQINAGVLYSPGTATAVLTGLYKNGSLYHNMGYAYMTNVYLDDFMSKGSCVIYLNGSTDYAELYGYLIASSPAFYGSAGNNSTFFEAVLVRAD